MARAKKIEAGKRFPLSLRITADMRERLQNAAEETGRSVSQEVEFRLERSFVREDEVWGGAHIERLMRVLATLVQTIEDSTGKKWVEDKATRTQILAAFPTVLEMFVGTDREPANWFRTGIVSSPAPRGSAAELLTGKGGKK